MASSLHDIVEITLIISDLISTKIQLSISKATTELITQLCKDLTQRFGLNVKTEHKLFNHICKELSVIQIERKKKMIIENQRSEYFDHLYYYYISKKQEKEQYYKKLRQDNLNKEITQCSFVPSINLKSSQLYKRDYQRIEDKLYREAKVLGNKKLNRRKNTYFNNQLNTDSISDIEENISKKPLIVDNNKEIRRVEENKENDILTFHNEIILNERPQTQSSKSKNDKNQIKTTSKIRESYVERFKNQRHSFHKHTVQANSSSNNNYENKAFDSGKAVMNPMRKYTSINNQKGNLSLENNQQLISDKVNKTNSNKRKICPIDNSNNETNKFKNTRESNKENLNSSLSFTFIINNNQSSNKVNWIYRKAKSSSKLTMQKEKEMNKMYKIIYPFKPEISKSSRAMVLKKRKEDKGSLFKRLSESKRDHSVRNALNDLHSISTCQPNLNNKSISIRNSSNHSKKKVMIYKHENNLIKTEPNYDTVITINPQSTSFTERKKKSTEAKQEIEIIQSMKEIEIKENNNKMYYKNQYVNNIEKFKLNQLKEIYEILTRNGEGIDLDTLTKNGVPQHIKEKVILPTCYMINNKNLEFNFQNFYLIASEILARYF